MGYLSYNKKITNSSSKYITFKYTNSEGIDLNVGVAAGGSTIVCVKGDTTVKAYDTSDGTRTELDSGFVLEDLTYCNYEHTFVVEGGDIMFYRTNAQLESLDSKTLSTGTHLINLVGDSRQNVSITPANSSTHKIVSATNFSSVSETAASVGISALAHGGTSTIKIESKQSGGGSGGGGGGGGVTDKCTLNLSWSTSYNTKLSNGNSTYHVSVTGNNGNVVQFRVDGGAWGDGGTDGKYSFDASRGIHTVDARIKDCDRIALSGGIVNGTDDTPPPTPQPDPKIEFTSSSDISFNNASGETASISFKLQNDVKKIQVSGDVSKTIDVSGASATIQFSASELGSRGVKNLTFKALRDSTGGNSIGAKITVYSQITVNQPDLRNIKYPTKIFGEDYKGADVNFEISWDSIDSDGVRIKIKGTDKVYQGATSGVQKLNVKDILETARIPYDYYTSDNVTFTLQLTPYKNTSLGEATGRTEDITILFDKGDLVVPREVAITRLLEQFEAQFDFSVFADETSKYLTHVAHLGDGNNKPITTWVGDRGTLILKLYEPLSNEYQVNSELWISKLQSGTMIETINLSTEDIAYCKPLRGPNFNVESNDGFGFKIFNDLIQSGSISSNNLVSKYLEQNGVDTSELGIEYVDTDTYLFDNFVHFGSAEERINNFLYKVKMIDHYKYVYSTLKDSSHIPDGNADIITEYSAMAQLWEILVTEGAQYPVTYDINYEIARYNTINEEIEAKNALDSINNIIRSFDGFERFLYFDTSNLALSYPKYQYTYPNGVVVYLPEDTEASQVQDWYDSILSSAVTFDDNNINYIANHIPEFIISDADNQDFVVFLDMIGQHFDNIWLYINKLKTLKTTSEQMKIGINDDMIYHLLKSFGWDGRRAYNSNYLWEYVYGTDKDGAVKYGIPLRDANNQVWRRIFNNLPYLLKHKGTSRSLKAILSCYGIPSSLLTIMEFSGIQQNDKNDSREYTYDDYTAALNLISGSSINVGWKKITSTNTVPDTIELRFLPTNNSNFRLLSGSKFFVDFTASNSEYSTIYFGISGSGVYTSSLFPLSIENFSNILVRRGVNLGSNTVYDVNLQTTNGVYITNHISMSVQAPYGIWDSGSAIKIGGNYNGQIDEFRLWKGQLDIEKYEIHTLQPDSIVGNSYTASTADLMVRLDFEYPKNLASNSFIKNVSITNEYNYSYATASNMYSANTYPYQYTPYERTVTATVPALGNTVSNKIRFEDITLVSDLSPDTRSSIKSFDRSGVDTNRLGIFLSPIKELNMDIIKTFGKFNIDNYIGNPEDDWHDSYKELDTIRNYYFQRLDRNIYEYINLVKYIDKSLFDVLADLTPARSKVSKGLLIEPHYLERSKTRITKPIGEYDDYVVDININDAHEIDSDYNYIDTKLNVDNSYEFLAENSSIESLINTDDMYKFENEYISKEIIINAFTSSVIESEYPTYPYFGSYNIDCIFTGSIQGELDTTVMTMVGMDPYSIANIGFGLYAIPQSTGSTLYRTFSDLTGQNLKHWTYYDSASKVTTSGSWNKAYLLKEKYVVNEPVYRTGSNGSAGSYFVEPKTYYKYIVSFTTGSSIKPSGNIVESNPVGEYLPYHYRFVNTLSEGDRRSFFKGSTQTILTTPDGKSPVEIVYTNPNKLKVSPTGRGAGEPILIVE